MTRKVYIAMPTRDRPHIETQFSLLAMQRDFDKNRVPHVMRYTIGDSMLPKVRNFYVADFLASNCTDLIMLDDDLKWEDGAIMRLLSHDCEVVGGVYPKREEPKTYPVKLLPGQLVDPKTGLLEVQFLPTGFLRITRSCLERMVAAYPHLAYYDKDAPGETAHALFWFDLHPDPENGRLTCWGEDFTFCRRWRDIGGKVMADTLLHFFHMGGKGYQGCYAEDLPASMFAQPALMAG